MKHPDLLPLKCHVAFKNAIGSGLDDNGRAMLSDAYAVRFRRFGKAIFMRHAPRVMRAIRKAVAL